MRTSPIAIASPFLASALYLTGCDVSSPPVATASPVEQTRITPSNNPRDLKQRQMAFLNRIRAADPQQHTIDRALLNEQNELGLVLDRSVEMEKIPELMRVMLTQMAQEFPNQNLTIIAYAPSNPPLKVGTAHFDTRTRDMTYIPQK
jgi:hypothetical protein